jgi:hypothetical protein
VRASSDTPKETRVKRTGTPLRGGPLCGAHAPISRAKAPGTKQCVRRSRTGGVTDLSELVGVAVFPYQERACSPTKGAINQCVGRRTK